MPVIQLPPFVVVIQLLHLFMDGFCSTRIAVARALPCATDVIGLLLVPRPDDAKIRQNLRSLEEEERSYAKMYGQSMMSDDVYKERMGNVLERRNALKKLRVKNDELADKVNQVDPKALTTSFQTMLQDLSFKDKQFVTRRLTAKIVATKEEVTIHGFLPILDVPTDRKDKLSAIYRCCRLT